MTNSLAAIVLPQLDDLLTSFEKLRKRKRLPDWFDIKSDDAFEFVAAAVAAIHRVSGSDSQFARQADDTIRHYPPPARSQAIPDIGGILKALRQAVASGYLSSVQELIHADVFSDFLEMAEHLLEEGYKDPAAVLVGGVLEEHLRKLCGKNNIPTDYLDSKGISRPKKAESMNTDLAGQGAYSKLDQKSVTAWLAVRNDAAHGHYGAYTQEQVKLLLQSVRDFLVRNPA